MIHLFPRAHRAPAARPPRRALRAAAALLCSLPLALPAFATPTFSEYVAEKNLAPTGLSVEHFPEGDAVHRRNGALIQRYHFGGAVPVSERFSYQLGLVYTSSIWHFVEDGPGAIRAEPHPRFDAGLGWRLDFGELLAPGSAQNPDNHWVYRSPGGEVRRFYATLADGETMVPNVFYSRDSTYLRLRLNSAGAHVDFPDGRTRRFEQTPGGWRFDAELDVFGNWMAVDDSTPGQWRILDSQGRVHRIHFRTDQSGAYGQIVDRVEMAAFGGATAVWQLSYRTETIPRPPQDASSVSPPNVDVPLLDEIQGPEGTLQRFDYADPTVGGPADAGRLDTLRLATGGTVTYRYGDLAFPYVAGAHHTADVVGVVERQLWGFVGSSGLLPAAPVGTWTLAWSLDRPRTVGDPNQPRELTAEIHYPDGHRRTHKFSVYVSGDAANDQRPSTDFQAADYGLPFTQNGRGSTNPLRPSVQIFDTDGTTSLRRLHVRYSRSPCAGCWDGQPRLDHSRILYDDTPARAMDTKAWTHFDGLGHFARTVSIEHSGFAPMRTMLMDRSLPRPGPQQPWILGLSQRREVTEGADSRVTESCVDPATGLVTRRRTLASATRGANDLLRVYGHDAMGNLTSVRYYGGDVQALGTGADLCALALPAQEQFARYRTHRFGGLEESGWLDAAGQTFLVDHEATIDPSTGLPITTSSGDGFVWTHGYDLLGRTLHSTPPAGESGAQGFSYLAADPGATPPAMAVNTSTVTDDAGVVLSETRTHFDAFGRVARIERDTDDGFLGVDQTYDAMGRTLSTQTADGAMTRNLAFDGLGRILRVRPPAGAAYDRTFAYTGRSASETVKIGKRWDVSTNSVIEVDRTTRNDHDRHGRRWRRTYTDGDGQWLRESLQLNLRGAAVSTHITNGAKTSQWTTADRTDHRGFVVSEPDGTPILGYDALGHRTFVDTPEGTQYHLRDRAARPVETRTGSADPYHPGSVLWTRNTYATTLDGDNYRRGKLVSSLRINRDVPHLPDGHVEVTDRYEYRGQGGSASTLTTEVTAGLGGTTPIARFATGRELDGLGSVTSVNYPDCDPQLVHPATACVPTAGRVVHYDRSHGRLTGLRETWGGVHAGWIDQIAYDPSGVPTTRLLANGFVEQATVVPASGGRAERMTLTDPQGTQLYDSGIAVYDGRGRLVQLGQQRRVSDATYALTVPEPPGDAGTTQTLPPAPNLDPLGAQRWRSYRIPHRHDPVNSHENVWEVYVYGPGNRPVWTRVWNDYDAFAHGYSKDTWRLIGLDGAHLRTRPSLTYYQGPATFQGSTFDRLDLSLAFTKRVVDRILLGRQLFGISDHAFFPGRKSFYHRDLRQGLLAITDQDGQVLDNTSPLQ
ncbi:MAG: hypothetical protein AAGN66_23495 [Acidobacteriota bacterium]